MINKSIWVPQQGDVITDNSGNQRYIEEVLEYRHLDDTWVVRSNMERVVIKYSFNGWVLWTHAEITRRLMIFPSY